MGDTTTGPSGNERSGTAQRAQGSISKKRPGLFAKLFAADKRGAPRLNGAMNGATVSSKGHSSSPVGGLGNLNRVRVQDVAIPRAEIISVPIDIAIDPLVDVFRAHGLTRLPIFDETLDSPLGFIHLKDFALKHGFSREEGDLAMDQMLRPLLFAPPSMPIGVLLQKMQTEHIHMALVIDEYGGVDGLVTIEDLIEQVVGEIEDEHDIEEEDPWTLEKPGVYLCQAKAPLDEFEAETGLTLINRAEEDEIETLGGLVFVLAGHVPVRGEVICHENGLEFEILDADPRRIKKLRVALRPLGTT